MKTIIECLEQNNIEQDNIIKFMKLKEYAEKLGFVLNDHDGMDDRFYVTFEIENKFDK